MSVDAFVAELERRLKGRIEAATLEARLREIRSHLAAAAAERGEAAALREFGTPAATARALVRQARGYDARSAASLAWAPGLVLLLSFVAQRFWAAQLPFHVAFSGDGVYPQPADAAFRLGLWIPFLGVLLFARFCLRTRRWLFLPAAAWIAAGQLVLAVAIVTLVSGSPPNASKRIESLRHQLGTPSQDEREIAFWRAGDPPSWTVPYAQSVPRPFSVPGLPFFVYRRVPIYDVRLFHGSRAAARHAWAENGEGWAETVAARRQGLRDELATLEAGRGYPSLAATRMAGPFLWSISLISAVLLAFNALALGLGRLADALPGRPVRR